MPASKETWPGSGRRVERITWLADAIFAFSITLLAIDLLVPEIAANLVATELPLALINLIPRFIGFLLTYWIISSHWIAYHRLMSYVVQYDRGFISTVFTTCWRPSTRQGNLPALTELYVFKLQERQLLQTQPS